MPEAARVLGLELDTSGTVPRAREVRQALTEIGGAAQTAQQQLGVFASKGAQSTNDLATQQRLQATQFKQLTAEQIEAQKAFVAAMVASAEPITRPINKVTEAMQRMQVAAAKSKADAMASQIAMLDPFQKAGAAGEAAGNNIARGARLASAAMGGSITSLRSFAVEAALAAANSAKASTGMTGMARASASLSGAVAALGGGPMVALVLGIAAVTKGFELATAHYQKQIDKFEEIGEAADKAREKIVKAIIADRDLSRDTGNAQNQLGAFRRGGQDGLDAELRRQEVADKTRAAMVAVNAEWAKFDDAQLRSLPKYAEIHRQVLATVTATRALANEQKAAAEFMAQQAKNRAADHQAELADLRSMVKEWKKVFDLMEEIDRLTIGTKDITGVLRPPNPFNLPTDAIGAVPPPTVSPIKGRANMSERDKAIVDEAYAFEDAMDRATDLVVGGFARGGGDIQAAAQAMANDLASSTANLIGGIGGTVFAAVASFAKAIGPDFAKQAQEGAAKVAAYRSAEDALARARLAGNDAALRTYDRERELSNARTEAERILIAERHAVEDNNRAHDEAVARKRVESDEVASLELELARARAAGNEELLRQIELDERLSRASSDAARELIKQIAAQEAVNRAMDEFIRKAREWITELGKDVPFGGKAPNPPIDKGGRPGGPFTDPFADAINKGKKAAFSPFGATPIVPGEDFIGGPLGIDKSTINPAAQSSSAFQGITATAGNVLVDLARAQYTQARTQTAVLRMIERNTRKGGATSSAVDQINDEIRTNDQSRIIDV